MAQGRSPESIDEQSLSRYMAMSYAPDPDLFIRTGGEVRISNFLLWQSAYAEMVFADTLWPDFDEAELDRCLKSYAARERRFGDVGQDVAPLDDVSGAGRSA
jgi:undecaprenyl diphosphate synthase